jgi:ribosome assembly protein RRB1
MAPGSKAFPKSSPSQENTKDASTRSKRKACAELSKVKIQDEPDTELVFEDPYGDDFETDDEDDCSVDGAATASGTRKSVLSGTQPMVLGDKAIFRPGIDMLADGETLVCDETAYDVLHRVSLDWPALSFDFVCCDVGGSYTNMDAVRQTTYPVSVMLVAGTQAHSASQNKIQVLKLSNMHRTRKKYVSQDEDEGEDEEDESDDESDDEGAEADSGMADGTLANVDIKFDSVVNRVRAMPQQASIVAVWGESGRVSLLDVAPALDSLNRGSLRRMAVSTSIKPTAIKPFMSFNGHKEEGFALDWSRVCPGRLASGSVNGSIYMWEMSGNAGGDGSWSVSPDKFRGHRGTVEDIQWSPNEKNVFASCSTDKSIRFWDAREYRKPALSVANAHEADVNVISWNRNEAHLMVSGGDEGSIKVWDLRLLNQKCDNKNASPAAEFAHHRGPITSVEWHPLDASMLAVSSEDGSVSIWDLAVERDAEEELREGVVLPGADQYPPQLMFIHMGQRNTKELHWHPGCNSLLASTAEDGMNVFKAANITLPS